MKESFERKFFWNHVLNLVGRGWAGLSGGSGGSAGAGLAGVGRGRSFATGTSFGEVGFCD